MIGKVIKKVAVADGHPGRLSIGGSAERLKGICHA
jgi:hypothetical protein